MSKEKDDGLTEIEREIAKWEAWRATPPVVLAKQYIKAGLEFDADGLKAYYEAAYAAGEQAERERTKRLVEDMQNELRQRRMVDTK